MRIRRFFVALTFSVLSLTVLGGGTASATTVPPTGVQVSIQPVHSEKCLDVPGASFVQGVQIKQYGCHFAPHQRFVLELRVQAVNPADNQYAIRPVHSGYCFDIPGASPNNGVVVAQYACHYGPHQRFYVRDVLADRPGQYSLIAVHSEQCLDVVGASSADATPVAQYGCHFGPHQRFTIIPR